VFRYSTIRYNITAFNGMNFTSSIGFGFYSSCNASYYVIDHGTSRAYILNGDWSYVSYKNFSYPTYMITIGSRIYMTGSSNIWKLDKDLNILIQFNSTGNNTSKYRGIYYNSKNGFIYAAPMSLTEIQVFDLNLAYNHNISISPYKPYSISEYNNKMFVGTTNGTILVIQNEMIINQFNGCNGDSVQLTSILFDQYGYMATICSDPTNKLYLYNSNGTYTGTSLSTPVNPRYIGFDTKGRFILISYYQMIIYN
jgi:hypothetical protein